MSAAAKDSAVTACDPRILVCPKCRKPLRRLTAGEGSFTLLCENRELVRRRDGSMVAQRCGQPVHVLAHQGVAFVVPISHQEYERSLTQFRPAGDVYRAEGIIGVRVEPARSDGGES